MDTRAVVVLAVAAMVALSGCAVLTGETLEFSASKATVSDSAVEQAAYDEIAVEQKPVNRTFTVAGQEREVSLTNWVASYQRDLAVTTSPAPGTVTVLSTPEINIAGQTLNPIGTMSDRELLDTLLENYEGISDVSQEETRQIQVLGQSTDVTTFSAVIDYQGQEVEVTIHLTTVKHEGDVVVGVGVHPAVISSEEAGVDTMLSGIQHATG